MYSIDGASLDASFHDNSTRGTKGEFRRLQNFGNNSISQMENRLALTSTGEDNADTSTDTKSKSSGFSMTRDENKNGLDDLGTSSHHRREDMMKGYSMFNASRVYDDSLLVRKSSAELGFDLMAIPASSDSSIPLNKGDLDMDCHADKNPVSSSMLRQMNKYDADRKSNGRSGKVTGLANTSPTNVSPVLSLNKKTELQASATPSSSATNNNAQEPESTQPAKIVDLDDDSSDSSDFNSDDDSFCMADDKELASKAYIVQDLGASFYFNDEEFFNHHVKPHLVEDDDAGSLDEVIEEQVIVETILPPASKSMKSLFPETVDQSSQDQAILKTANSTDDDSDCDSFCDATGQDVADLRYLEKDLGASCFWGEECPTLGKKKKKASVMDEETGNGDNAIMTIGEDDEEEEEDDNGKDNKDVELEGNASISEEDGVIDNSSNNKVELVQQQRMEESPSNGRSFTSRAKSQPLGRVTSLRMGRSPVEKTKTNASTRSFFRSSISDNSNETLSSPEDGQRRKSGRLRKIFGMRSKSNEV